MSFKFILLAVASSFLTRAVAQHGKPFGLQNIGAIEPASIRSRDDDDGYGIVFDEPESPSYTLMYEVALPIPPIKEPKMIIKSPVTGQDIQYYEIEIMPFEKQVYPDLQATRMVGYDGMYPGPTIMVPKGTESVVRVMNQGDRPNSVHLHGSPTRASFDGWAEDTTKNGEYKDYYYGNNESARFIWYHDHTMGNTSENAYMGQAGGYIIHDPANDALGLPSGYGEFDIPLILSSLTYNSDGTLKSTVGEALLYGSVIHVNGQPWPFFNVKPRKYRLRFLNAAITRAFALYFVSESDSDAKINFQVIASDSGLFEAPVQTDLLYVSMAERYEVVIDFTNFAGQSVYLLNNQTNGIDIEDNFNDTDKVMRFNVSASTVQDSSIVPSSLRSVPFPPSSSGIDHQFLFDFDEDGVMAINNVTFADVDHRILANVPRGTVETWELINNSTLFTHPIHIHLVDFRVLSREDTMNGTSRGVMPYESAGLKDVVWLGLNEKVVVEAHYAPWDGVYMFHCHNLLHEDNDMMAVFNVTALTDFGYNETTDYQDPMDIRWRPQPYDTTDYGNRSGIFSDKEITEKVEKLALEQPYSQQTEVEQALAQYWTDNGKDSPNSPRQSQPDAREPVPRYRRLVV